MAPELKGLSRRERQIMDVLYRKGRGTVNDVLAGLADAPGYSSVRTLLRILEEKGHLHHEEDGARYVYVPKVPQKKARSHALRQVVKTFFNDSVDQAVLALLELKENQDHDPKALERLRAMLQAAKKAEKKGVE